MNLTEMIQISLNVLRVLYIKVIHGKNFSAHPIQRISFLSKFNLNRSGQVKLGRNICINRFGDVFIGSKGCLEIGNKVFFNNGSMVSCQNKVKIGDHCLFGPGVKIFDNDHHFDKENGVSSGKHSVGEVIIGNNCWIAANVIILKDTVIGDNCVIGAGTIVKGNIPSHSVVKSDRSIKVTPIK